MNIVVQVETDCVIILLKGSDLVRLTFIHIRTAAMHILHIAGTVVGNDTSVHHAITISRTGLKAIHDHLVDLTYREHSVSACIIIFVTFLVIEMRTVVWCHFHPCHSIDIGRPYYSKTCLCHTLDIWSANNFRSLRFLSIDSSRPKNNHQCQNMNLFHSKQYILSGKYTVFLTYEKRRPQSRLFRCSLRGSNPGPQH